MGIGALETEADLRSFILQQLGHLPQQVAQLQGAVKGWVPEWLVPVPGSGWALYTDLPHVPRVAADSAREVKCRGWMSATRAWVLGGAIATLPFRPGGVEVWSFDVRAMASGAAGTARVDLLPDGTLTLADTALVWGGALNIVSLAGVSFWAEG